MSLGINQAAYEKMVEIDKARKESRIWKLLEDFWGTDE